MAKVTADNLASEIQKILDEYGETVMHDMEEVTKAVAKKGVQALRNSARSSFGGTGEYAKGWTSKIESGRLGTKAILHNAGQPGLPHLLEHGHANRGGGRTPGRVHIAPIEQELIETFEKQMEAKLS